LFATLRQQQRGMKSVWQPGTIFTFVLWTILLICLHRRMGAQQALEFPSQQPMSKHSLLLEGERWWKHSPDPRNPVACATCHHDSALTHGWAASFPKVRPLPPPHTRVMTLLQASAEAVTRHYGLADPRRAATAITAYLTSVGSDAPISPGVSVGQPIFEGRLRQLNQSVKRGEATFADRCRHCHAAQGVSPLIRKFPQIKGREAVPLESFLETHQPTVRALTWDGQDMADLVAYLMSQLAGQPLITKSAEPTGKEK
jgi:cytochrome c553